MGNGDKNGYLKKYISPMGAWALALGCSVGWGAFVMPGTTFLPVAGPMGTLIGLGIATLLMLVLAANYHYMMNHYKGAGGVYDYATESFGYGHGFLSGWFLILAYVVVFWGNATALPMIARNLLGEVFQIGLLYTIFGYDVYLGEVLVAVGMMLLAALVCLRPRLAVGLQIAFALIFTAGIAVCAAVLFFGPDGFSSLKPSYAPDIEPSSGIFSIVSLAPWAFVGFETISHSTGEFRFKKKNSFLIMMIALICAFAAYALLALISVARLPEGQSDWVSYLGQIGSFDGIMALPTFSSVKGAMGDTGVIILGLSAFAAISTGLIGFLLASSRLLYSISLGGMLTKRFQHINSRGVPDYAILGVMIISLPVPFFGRTAINWLVDVTTICVIIAYAYVSASALRLARRQGSRFAGIMGIAGLLISCCFAVVFLVPNLLMIRTMSAESYLLIAVWAILGLLWFRIMYSHGLNILQRPTSLVWGIFLVLIIYTSLIWVLQTAAKVEIQTSENIERHFAQEDGADTDADADTADSFVKEEMQAANRILRNASLTQIGFILTAMVIIFNIYDIMQKRAKKLEIEKVRAEENSRAKSLFLSNMSHDIRTPMNAIIGMTNIASDHIDDKERVKDCLAKISVSGKHLLGLINNILDMSKIESGKMTFTPEPLSLRQSLQAVCDIVRSQADTNGQKFDMIVSNIQCEDVYCDSVRLNQVLLNLLSNAMKYTPAGGSVEISLWQESSAMGQNYVQTHIEVKDSGIGMSEEYQEKLFMSFEREDSLRVHKTQGTGLGLAITKYIIDAMSGKIEVVSQAGVGTCFHVTLDLERVHENEAPMHLPEWHILIVDDNEDLCRAAEETLQELGTIPQSCQNGEDAVRIVQEAHQQGKDFFAVIADDHMEGTDALEIVRNMKEVLGSDAPLCLISTYSRAEIEEAAKAAGVSGLVEKPLFKATLYNSLYQFEAGSKEEDQEENTAEQERYLAGKRILLAEDNELNAEIATMILEENGASIEWTEDGKIASEKFAESEIGYYDAVLMDLRMPHMNGIEAAKAIRAMDREDARNIPIIAMTADAFAEDAKRCLDAGMNEHLTKPIDVDRLKAALLKYL